MNKAARPPITRPRMTIYGNSSKVFSSIVGITKAASAPNIQRDRAVALGASGQGNTACQPTDAIHAR
jgi:hypothetical protein